MHSTICNQSDKNRECEKKLVETMVEPGGIRVKPNDNLLI